MIISKDGQMHLGDQKDYDFMKQIDDLISNYCGEDKDLRKKILSNFFVSFKLQDE